MKCRIGDKNKDKPFARRINHFCRIHQENPKSTASFWEKLCAVLILIHPCHVITKTSL